MSSLETIRRRLRGSTWSVYEGSSLREIARFVFELTVLAVRQMFQLFLPPWDLEKNASRADHC